MLAAAQCGRYLRALGVPSRAPSLDALTELTAAHLTRVPFENLSKLLRFRRTGFRGIPDLEAFLDGIERFQLGGTCYSNSFHLHQLLRALGYEAHLCGADMSRPDVHLVNRVRLDGRDYLVDAGYGAPFLAPMALDLARDQEIVLGADRYVLKPRDGTGRSRLDQHRDGAPGHGYTLKPESRRIEEFARVIEDSFAPAATFMNALLVTRFWPGRSRVLRNLALSDAEGAALHVRRVPDVSALPGVIEESFGIPGAVAAEALQGLSLSDEVWG